MICNSSTQDGHQHAAEMRDDRLDREIRPFAPRAYTVHCRRIDHDRRHPVAAPQKENPAVEHGRRRMHVGESEEVKCRYQDKHREQDARARKRPIRRTIIPPANEERNPTNVPATPLITPISFMS